MQQHIVQKPGDVISVTISSTSTALTEPDTDVIGGIMVIETADVRMRWDGVAPESGAGGGLLMAKDSVWEIIGRDFFMNMRFIADTGDDALVVVAYETGG